MSHYSKLFLVIVTLCLTILIHSHEIQVTRSEIDISKEENRFDSFESEFLNFNTLENEQKLFTKKADSEMFISSLKFLSKSAIATTHTSDDSCNSRPHDEIANAYYFFPTFKARVKTESSSSDFSSGCFKQNKFTLEKLSLAETVITLYSAEPKHLLCSDSYWISTSSIHVLKEVLVHGEHRITLKNLSQDDLDEIKVNGVKILAFCQGFFTSLHSFYLTLKLYIGGLGNNNDSVIPILKPGVPDYMVNANLRFLDERVNFRPQSRGEAGKSILDIDEKEIKSGDFIAIYRLDGLDPLIMWGSGSRIGHSAVACWIDGELYVLESQDGWYWPKRGIQRNKWKQWVQWAYNADFNVAILPLREEFREKFDVEKALNWFTSGIEGLNYGYHNFLFSWLDTVNGNLPVEFLQMETVLSVFAILEKVSKATATTIIGEALNQRINTNGLSIPQVTAEAARRGISFEELIAMPELENWKYSDGSNYTCSCFVTAFWKNGGVFGDLEILPKEFTPKDVYQLNVFDFEYKDKRPQACKDADPNVPYCQIIGKYQVLLDGYNTLTPYSHMNEKCPSLAPEYFRPSDC